MLRKNAVNNTPNSSPSPSPNQAELNAVKLTDKSILKIKPQVKRKIFWIEGHAGFGLRVTPKGTKSWIYQYDFYEKSRMITLGRYPKLTLTEARKKYQSAVEDLERGLDPSCRAVIRDNNLNMEQLIEKYIEFCKETNLSSWKDRLNYFKKDIIPKIGKKKVHLVTEYDLIEIFDELIFERKSLYGATHLYTYMRRLFNFAADRKINKMRRRDNPCLDIKLGIRHKSRKRHLSPTEIYLFWHKLESASASPIMKLALKFMLCTVVRGIEIRQFQWKHFDPSQCVWTLPDTKNGTSHRVHLGRLATGIFNEAKMVSKHPDFVFGSINEKSSQSIGLTDGAMAKVIRRSRDIFDILERFTPHDLRRTSATIIAAMTGDREYVKRALNHVQNDATAHYDQYLYDKEKKIGADVLNYVLERIVHSPDAQSVPALGQLRAEIEANGLLQGKTEPKETQVTLASGCSTTVSYSLSFDPLKLSA